MLSGLKQARIVCPDLDKIPMFPSEDFDLFCNQHDRSHATLRIDRRGGGPRGRPSDRGRGVIFLVGNAHRSG